MEKRYFTDYSYYVGRDMTWHVHGSAGRIVIALPSQGDRCWDYENNGMVAALAPWIERGEIMLVCADGADDLICPQAGRGSRSGSLALESYYNYILRELMPMARRLNPAAPEKMLITGCSLGGGMAADVFFRKPELFSGVIALSGWYRASLLLGDYTDDLTYQNSPAEFLLHLPADDPRRALYAESKIYLCCGQGGGEETLLPQLDAMQAALEQQNIPAVIDRWGWDVNHDWYWWQKQIVYFMEKALQ